MATSTFRDLCLGPRIVGMMLRNLSTWEIRNPPKTVIGNVQTAEIVPNMKASKHTSEVLPSMKQKEPIQVIPPTAQPPKKELIQLTSRSLQLKPGVQTSEHDVLGKVDLLGYAKSDPKDQ